MNIFLHFSTIISRRIFSCLVAFVWLGVSPIVYSNSIHHAVTGGKPVVETVLTYEDNGKTIETIVGTLLEVRLEESPTTGYVWSNKTAGNVVLLKDTDFSAASPGTVGGAGLRTLRFVVSKPGQATLLLKQMREWEGESSAIKVFSVTIHAAQH